ncbi:MAG TPA: sulfotransferase [Spongiibacteraceae bacterium]|nr:sulfotransferase [Spongiibacteraceae bacterium]
MSNAIRIDDLKHPQLTAAQQAAVEYGKTLQVDFSEGAILAAARKKTGLSDFGADDFRTRLRLLCDEWGGDADVNGLHRSVLYGYLFRYACNRLLIQDAWNKHPEIFEQKIEKPLIVIGLPRSGTTHLVNLLAADQRFHSLPLWESYEPVALSGEIATCDSNDPRYQRCAQAWAGMQQTLPLLAAMHPMNPDHIHEELELMGPDFASYNFEWLSPSPRWRDHYYASDQTPHYQYMIDVLKLIQWRRGEPHKRWVLKCPQHLEQIPVLHKLFPDATFAVTHRDPVAVIQSTVTMLAYGERTRRATVDTDALMDYWGDRIEHLLRACVRDRDLLPAHQSIDVLFHEFMADDLAMVEKIYGVAGLSMTDTVRGQLMQFLAKHPRGKEGRVIYDLSKDFGVEPAQLRERFDFYFKRFPVVVES